MMKAFYALSLIFFLIGCSKKKRFNDVENEKIIGKVNTIFTSNCIINNDVHGSHIENVTLNLEVFNKGGNLTKRIDYDKYGNISNVVLYQYAKKKITIIALDKTLRPTGLSVNITNESGDPVYDSVFDNFHNLIQLNVYVYNLFNQVTEICYYDNNGKISSRKSFNYDIWGNQIDYYEYSRNDKPIETVNNIFDNRGNIIEEHYIGYYPFLKTNIYTKFDNFNRRILRTSFNSKGTLLYWDSTVYDSHSNCLESLTYNINKKILITKKHKLTYDENGNWISDIISDKENKNWQQKITRKIEYFITNETKS